MAIKSKKELSFDNKKTEMVIYSRPGYGKTTLALSAPKPLLIDFEDGIGRVEACYHDTTMQAEPTLPQNQKFASFMNDLENEDFKEYIKDLNPSLSLKRKYELYQKNKPKEEIKQIGSLQSGKSKDVKEYYSDKEISKMTLEDLDNDEVWEAVRRSMTR